jgi:hypothetical protein
MIWVLQSRDGDEMLERCAFARSKGGFRCAFGENTHEEAEIIADRVDGVTVDAVTSSYHVPRAYLTIAASLKQRGISLDLLRVRGVGAVDSEAARREARKLAEYQAKGHALRWEDV